MGKQIFSLGTLIVFILVISALGGYFYFFKRTPESPTVQNLSNTVPPQSQQPGTKTYTNKLYGFTISYPDTLTPDEVDIPNKIFTVTFFKRTEDTSVNLMVGSKSSATEVNYGSYNWSEEIITTLAELGTAQEADFRQEHLIKLDNFSRNGFTGVKYESTPIKGSPIKSPDRINLALIKGERTYLFTAPKDLSAEFNQIISTFQP